MARGDKIALDAGTLSPVEFTDCHRMCCHSRMEEVSEALLARGLITRKSEAEEALEELSSAMAYVANAPSLFWIGFVVGERPRVIRSL